MLNHLSRATKCHSQVTAYCFVHPYFKYLISKSSSSSSIDYYTKKNYSVKATKSVIPFENSLPILKLQQKQQPIMVQKALVTFSSSSSPPNDDSLNGDSSPPPSLPPAASSLVTLPVGILDEVKRLKLDELFLTIQSLYDASCKVSQFAHEYDFESQKFNGYRSFLKIIQSYFYEIEAFLLTTPEGSSVNNNNSSLLFTNYHDHLHLLARPLNRHKLTPSKRRDKVLNDLIAVGCFFLKQFLLLELVRRKELASKSVKQDELEDLGDGVFVHPYERQILNLTLAIRETDLMPFFTPEIRNFWLHGASRKLMDVFLTMGLTRVIPYHQSIRMIFDDSIKPSAGAYLSLNCEVLQQKAMWSIMEDNLYRMFQKLKTITKPLYSETAHIHRQKLFGLLEDGSIDASGDYPGLKNSDKSIECMYIYSERKGFSYGQNLIFHCHGGGFVAMTPKGHEAYLKYWCENLNIPVFCPNYGKAPESPYPYGLQDLLDAYLFVTSGSPSANNFLGFKPKSVVITGDSAGGNLALALTLLLHEISKIQPNSKLLMPNAIYLLYPTANSACDISASRSMCTFDPILNLAAVFSVAQAYTCKYEKSSIPWYRKDVKSMEQVLKTNIKKKDDPFVNPLCYKYYDELHNIQCFIQCCEFDPLLDDSISIAKLWKGPVTLDLVNDHCHGFMMMAGQKAVEPHLDTFFKRMKAGFKI